MNHSTRFATFVLMSLSILAPQISYARYEHRLTIVNHFDKPMHWMITINPQVLPGLPAEFSLMVNEQVSTEVLATGKEAYLAGRDDEQGNVFWGVEVAHDQLVFHGYISKAIAYSWSNDTITFCTPEEYKKSGGHC
ncbi:hypothetical protein [Legionella spiritensis]|uniref:Uncharacterized protein n=1 Tax=Legionella spiritensis TaxID=452 RepID=A0A0W0ZBT4_LEGSP|nr:hypothetical protein [Legionella spiritensis]KTD66339.1 hypothetical protein Lspi_0102 [Legionella spiritensis]SNV48702.1 Uncharacterised protein [Legionella spiritensis]